METMTFERVEKKWRMTPEQFKNLLPILEEHMHKDSYGKSTICSEFYDTPDFYLIRKSIERPPFKEKIRVRSYGIPTEDSPVFVEVKRKLNGIGYKRRISVPYKDAKRLMKGEAIGSDNPQIEKEFLELVKRYHPIPVATLCYERVAMYEKGNDDLRITIDFNMRYRTENTDLTFGDKGEQVLTDERTVLMEVKGSDGIPKWLEDELTRLRIYRAPFSKIGTAFSEHIAKTLSFGKK